MAKDAAPNVANDGGEPPLGPACGFFFMIGCVVISLALIITAYVLTGYQSERATSAIRQQLIPWIQESILTVPDREAIVAQLEELANDIEAEKLNDRQLRRLQARLSSAPIFQWGVVEAVLAVAEDSDDLSEAEKETLRKECGRLFRAAREGRISMNQLEFAVQQVASKEAKSGRLLPLPEMRASDIQEFSRRIATINRDSKVDDEPLDQSVAQAFRSIVEDALSD